MVYVVVVKVVVSVVVVMVSVVVVSVVVVVVVVVLTDGTMNTEIGCCKCVPEPDEPDPLPTNVVHAPDPEPAHF